MITNFKPKILSDLNDYSDFKLNKKNKIEIFCKNFFIYILLLKYRENFFKKNNIFIKKSKRKVFTILRSPYRHKLARHQIALNRYFINISFKIKISKKITIRKFSNILKLLNFFKLFNNMFESNLIFVNSFWFSFPVTYEKVFKII